MLSKTSEKTMHRVRWALTLGWLLLIASLYFDPVTKFFLDPNTTWSPFRLDPSSYLDPTRCPKIQGQCVVQDPRYMSAMIWWTMIVPAAILILMSIGHEFWRRICPLSFISQIPRALGIQRKRRVVDPITKDSRWEVVTIEENSWLGRNRLYVQFGLFLAGLSERLLFVNADRTVLGLFLLGTMFCAVIVGYLYGGKSWCNYFCPMAPVQMVYTGPRSLLGSEAHLKPKPAITQSMCRTVDLQTGQEISTCVACKSHCIDIDAEDSYWAGLYDRGRDVIAYGYLGAVIAFYFYYWLYSGDWSYYFSGAWTRERGQITHLFDPGFYFNGFAIPIPKLFAAPLTFVVFVAVSVVIGRLAEKGWCNFMSAQGRPVSAEQARHLMFTVFTVVSFWTFFTFGARPWVNRLHPVLFYGFNALVAALGFAWFLKTLHRSHTQYERERVATSLRKQLRKILDPSMLEGRSLEDLSPNEVYTLVKTLDKLLPELSRQSQLQAYIGVVQDLLSQQVVSESNSLKFFRRLRQDLNFKDSDHFEAMEAIALTQPDLLMSQEVTSSTLQNSETIARTVRRRRDRNRTDTFGEAPGRSQR